MSVNTRWAHPRALPDYAPKTTQCETSNPTIRVVTRNEIHRFVPAWQELSATSIVANPFYEPWTILPALDHLTNEQSIVFVLVLGREKRADRERLWGFFPLEIHSGTLHLPIRSLSLWQHRHCFFANPLIHVNHARETLRAFWIWLERNPFHCSIFDTSYLLAEGQFHHEWADVAIGRFSMTLNDFPRAFLKPDVNASAYMLNAISKKHLDEFLRLERRLAEMGNLKYRQIQIPSEVDEWIDNFLSLEAAGWKGGIRGNAFAKSSQDANYLRAITRAGILNNKVFLLSLELNGKAIAMKHNLLSSDGGFAFKIAYDEGYKKFSPGVLLELDNIRRVCSSLDIKWFDSCAAPRHVMANRLWSERRMIRRTLFSTGSRAGDLLISTIPLLRWFGKQIRRDATPSYLKISTTH